jgi:hypothetical protein
MQMNLCLSGLAGCYDLGVVDEAVARIRELHPDAVTFNEACAGDAALMARRTGYRMRFSRVIYRGRPLACIHPGGRGLFGDAVLTKAAIESTDSRPFEAQAGIERRVWLCVDTRVRVEVCTAHLTSQEPDESAASGPQCCERSSRGARPAAQSSSRATSTAPRPARLRGSGRGPTDPLCRTPAISTCMERERSAHPRPRCSRPRTPITMSSWSGRTSPRRADARAWPRT